MVKSQFLRLVADRLGSLGALAELHFAAIGGSLEQAIGILATLVATFQALLNEVRGRELAQAGQDLFAVATRLGAVAGTAQSDVDTLERLAGLAGAIGRPIAGMRAVLHEVEVLAMNARLAAATMGPVGADFPPFAAEIRRSAGAARASLKRLSQQLNAAGQHLRAASAEAGEFVRQDAGTLQAIPSRLIASVALIEAHGRRSGNAASIAGIRSGQMHGQVAAAIVVLQLGDITRQQIEHSQRACQILAEADTPAALGCRLVAAQLCDTADELALGAAHVVKLLDELAVDAGDIARQGSQVYGTPDRQTKDRQTKDGETKDWETNDGETKDWVTNDRPTTGPHAPNRQTGSSIGALESDTRQAEALLAWTRCSPGRRPPVRAPGRAASVRVARAVLRLPAGRSGPDRAG